MANDERRYRYQPQQELQIEDLPEAAPEAQDDVKGGMIRRGGIVGMSDPDSGDEVITGD